ncbi:LuxR C-terminal-related transcriptional regulator [Dactylosporangium sp. CA-092794]|uniref:LuxR C-terminal-related transcriptional regulator n=1 Tax=Dactylosporangium sp. CA-092794 TaxID=3239929 RepID=UPI003D9247B3
MNEWPAHAPAEAAPITVAIAHPDPGGLAAELTAGRAVTLVALATTAAEAITAVRRTRPAVILFDDRLDQPGAPGLFEAVARHGRVIALTAHTDPQAIGALLRGPVHGCLVYGHFEPEDLVPAVTAVARGLAWLCPVAAAVAAAALHEDAGRSAAAVTGRLRQHTSAGRLTPRQRDMLELLCQGLSGAAIAARLGVSEKTLRNQLNHSYAKLGVRNRAEAILLLTRGEDGPPGPG